MLSNATFVGAKRLVGTSGKREAAAERFTVAGRHGWMIFENGNPVGVEPSWDKAQERLRRRGYRVRAETRK